MFIIRQVPRNGGGPDAPFSFSFSDPPAQQRIVSWKSREWVEFTIESLYPRMRTKGRSPDDCAVWLCGGGGAGSNSTGPGSVAEKGGGGGGGGGYAEEYNGPLATLDMVVGSGGRTQTVTSPALKVTVYNPSESILLISKLDVFIRANPGYNAARSGAGIVGASRIGARGGSGGGGGIIYNTTPKGPYSIAAGGTGNSTPTYPFGDTENFPGPACAGGAGGGYASANGRSLFMGGRGGSNGSAGEGGTNAIESLSPMTTPGGAYGGGTDGISIAVAVGAAPGSDYGVAVGNATPGMFYGAGGGGGALHSVTDLFGLGANGHAGVVMIRIPLDGIDWPTAYKGVK